MPARLTEWQVSGIKADIEAEFVPAEIAKRRRCSLGAVQNYLHPEYRAKYRRPVPADQAKFEAKPHALPWVTKEMLTGARAPSGRRRTAS